MQVGLEIKTYPAGYGGKPWRLARPFFLNPRGVLIHRVRSVTTYSWEGKPSHHAVVYWCGNCATFAIGQEDAQLLDAPPAKRLLCVYCEARATATGRPTADTMVGKHVHKGVMRAHRTCCCGTDNN